MEVLFSSYDGRMLTLHFNPGEEESEDWLHFYSGELEAFSQLIITAYSIPDTRDLRFFEVECLDKNILCTVERCATKRELCDWLRSFLYQLDAVFSYPDKDC